MLCVYNVRICIFMLQMLYLLPLLMSSIVNSDCQAPSTLFRNFCHSFILLSCNWCVNCASVNSISLCSLRKSLGFLGFRKSPDIRYSEVKIHYLKYFGMLPSSVNLLSIYLWIYVCIYNIHCIYYVQNHLQYRYPFFRWDVILFDHEILIQIMDVSRSLKIISNLIHTLVLL